VSRTYGISWLLMLIVAEIWNSDERMGAELLFSSMGKV
jgi:hypothetical protein